MNKFHQNILDISLQIRLAQKPIHILDSIKRNDSIFEDFKKSKFKDLPKVDKTYYDAIPLSFNPEDKIKEFESTRKLITHKIGHEEPVVRVLKRQCLEYENVVRMLQARGTPDFYKYSKELYGSAADILSDRKTQLLDSGVKKYLKTLKIQT
jgi:hypothetical protein